MRTDSTGATTTSATVEPVLLDLQHLSRQTLGDAALQQTVLSLFLEEAPRYAADVLAAKSPQAWTMAVHTLKGVALNIGASRLASLCTHYEAARLAGERHPAQAHAIVAMIDETVTEMMRLAAARSGAAG